MMKRRTAFVATALAAWVALLFAPEPAAAQVNVQVREAPSNTAVDSIFAPWNRHDTPGCALGVVQNGQLVYARGYGMANLDYGIPNSPSMVYYVGSVSKQFTAASIALLAQQGHISLDDPVRRYVPELRDYGSPLSIRHLVHHTSGIRDIYVLMDLAGIRMEDVFPDDAALALIARQKELNFKPGSDYLYSNSGYWLLGQIVERVTGQSLREYARREIFEPLAMTHTHFHDDPGHVMKDRVVSYARAGDAYRSADLANFDKIGAGGLYTTVEDLLAWDTGFYEPRVGGAAWLQQMHSRGLLTTGDTLDYAFGLTLGMHRGLRTVRHGGSLMGFRAELLRFPDQRLTTLVLCNLATIAPAGLAERVAAVYLGSVMQPVVAAAGGGGARGGGAGERQRLAQAGTIVDAAAYTGTYRSEEVQAEYTLRAADGGLVLERPARAPAPLIATGDGFRAGNLTLRFMRDAAGRASAFTVEAGRVRNIRFDRIR
jgi:CubicO group peptidase (beta-lactamase class C family)